MAEWTNEQIKDVIDCVCFYDDLSNNEELDTINLIEDLRLSKNVHETAHSRILSKLLQVGKSQGFPLLKLFLESVAFPEKNISLDDASFYLEKENIDILITFGGKAIFIENKVNHAGPQPRQIEKYYKALQNGLTLKGKIVYFVSEDIYIYYLPQNKNEEDPPKESINPKLLLDLKKNQHYKKISFEQEICNWLGKCNEWLGKCNDYEVPTKSIESALIQYGEFIDNMFKKGLVSLEEMEITIKNVDEALKMTGKPLSDRIEKASSVRALLPSLMDAVKEYEREACVIELQEKYDIKAEITPYETGTDNNYKINFPVTYKGDNYKGVANIFPEQKKDGSYWFGVWADDRISIDDNTIKEATLCNIIEEKEDDTNTNEELDKYKTCYKSSAGGQYQYWKFCDPKLGIDNMIKEIAHYVKVLRKAK